MYGPIVVTGATGLQGSAVTRHLLRQGWPVRALTRRPRSRRARALAALGAEIVGGDMEDVTSLRRAFAGAYGVYSLQNPCLCGAEAEVRQGRQVGDVAREVGVRHLVYASAGPGRRTGVPSWDTKVEIEEHLRALGLPLTVLRPTAFMELMTERRFLPAVGTWYLMPRLAGGSTLIPWIGTDDLGTIAARVFGAPDRFVGRALALASDVQPLDACRAIHRDVTGRNPPRFPLPLWVYERMGFAGRDTSAMWRWLGAAELEFGVRQTLAIHPDAASVRDWLRRRTAAARRRAPYPLALPRPS